MKKGELDMVIANCSKRKCYGILNQNDTTFYIQRICTVLKLHLSEDHLK
jgi:hypothetical protein